MLEMVTEASSNISWSAEKKQDLSQDVTANLYTCKNMNVSLQVAGSLQAEVCTTDREA